MHFYKISQYKRQYFKIMNRINIRNVRAKTYKSQNISSREHLQSYVSCQDPKKIQNKENHNPNISYSPLNSKMSSHKKKIVLCRNKNSHSRSKGNSSKRKFSVQQVRTQVNAFDVGQKLNPSVNIEIDLYKQRKSVQDTMSSHDFLHIKQEKKCVNHQAKKASYAIKSEVYCEKCAVELITKKGMIAIKIDRDNDVKEERQKNLQNFISQIQKIQPYYEEMSQKLDKCQQMLEVHYRDEQKRIQKVWTDLIQKLTQAQSKWQTNVNLQYKFAIKNILELKKKVSSHLDYVVFMKKDVMSNVNEIIDPTHISELKFNNVIKNYKNQLSSITQTINKVSSAELKIATTEGNIKKVSQELQNLFTPSVQAFQLNINFRMEDGQPMHNKNEMCLQDFDPYRLSFGTEKQRVHSPSFKVI